MRAEWGFTLVEVLVALFILGAAGMAILSTTGHAMGSVHGFAERERRMWDQDRLMSAYTLLDHRDLERRLGTRIEGPYDVRIDRLDINVYQISLGLRGLAPDLMTVIHREREP